MSESKGRPTRFACAGSGTARSCKLKATFSGNSGRDYLNRLGYRLATEAVWEYAYRSVSRTLPSPPHGLAHGTPPAACRSAPSPPARALREAPLRNHVASLLFAVATPIMAMVVTGCPRPSPSPAADPTPETASTTRRDAPPARPKPRPKVLSPLMRRSRALAAERLPRPFEALKTLHRRMAPPKPGEWLASHHERGRSWRDYRRDSSLVRPGRKLTTIHIQLLGPFSSAQRKIVKLTADYMGRYFCLPVKTRPALPLSVVPATMRRTHPSWGVKQIHAGYVLDRILLPRRLANAVAYVAFTTTDLWPGAGWNFVFGMASLHRRVGVWSLYRNGDPTLSKASFRKCLLRSIKTGTHEVGHILGIHHCVAYDCNMNGSNHRAESDSRPLALCPVCLRKLTWNVRCDPRRRFQRLASFCRSHGLGRQEQLFRRSLRVLSPPNTRKPM